MISTQDRKIMNHDGVCTQVIGDGLTAADAIHGAELDWKVGMVDAGFRLRGGVFRASTTGRKAVCRLDADGTPVEDFGYVGRNYRPVQNVEMFDWADFLVEGAGAHFEAAWSMRGGKEIGLTMRFPENVMVAGDDPHSKYLLLRGRHDGTGSVTASVAMVRLFCTNQLDHAVRGAQRSVRVAHLSNATGKLASARETLQITAGYQDAFVGQMNALAGRSIDHDTSDAMVREVLSTQRFGGLDAKVSEILELAKTSGTIQDEFRGTRYGLLQATTEWLDWGHQGKTAASKLHDQLDGRIHKAKSAMVEALIK